jgi:hypothetical protein
MMDQSPRRIAVVDQKDVAIPWSPLPDIPQTPCAIEIDAVPGWVTVRAVYSFYDGERDLIVEMRPLIASLFDEIASPRIVFPQNYPNLTDPRWLGHRWPLMKIENSSWLAENRSRLFKDVTYEHVRIVSDDGSFDAIADRSSCNVEWVRGKGTGFYVPSYLST